MRQEKSDFVALNEENYVDLAEQVIESLERDKRGNIKLSTSQIRNILAMSSDIYGDVMEIKGDKLTPEIIGRINYLKVRIVYEEGRNPDVKDFAEKAKLRFYLDHISGSKEKFLYFSRYMEALVAFHRYNGGRD